MSVLDLKTVNSTPLLPILVTEVDLGVYVTQLDESIDYGIEEIIVIN